MIRIQIFLAVALNESTGKATPLKHVYNSLTDRQWQVAECTLLGSARACDGPEDYFKSK